MEFFEDGRTDLYNLASALSEEHDLSQAEPDRTVAMQRQLHEWQRSVDAQFPTPNKKAKSK